ncbi:LysE family translocator [Fertoebacter nigrum]|uniref:LysE family translocator n=1 Tax=Fertoeibacter niger TaxID=2656921 RepID=A0A8X8GVQ9_9RHOB|nr:LysE family translocator [Fertoeibacter niger]NUB44022.1 LysE family translocator [Fertoeibacter niger]
MTYDLFTALVAFAFVTSVTPGPNNLMLMASGANFGWSRTVPHMLGIGIGFVAMAFLVGLGLAGVVLALPAAEWALKLASVAYMLWLAWKIANAAPPKEGQAKGRPMTFLQAAAFQWVNPKAWAMALTATAVYAPDRSLASLALVAGVFGAVNLPSVSVWTLIGQQLRRVLTNPARLRAFNWTMAALLVASLYPVLRM